MASLAYMKLSGVKGPGVIKSDDRLNHIGILAFTHDVGSPPDTDDATDRLHHPIYVTKYIDFTTPALHDSLTNGTDFADGWINFFHMPRSGDENNYYSIVMTGIRVVSINSIMPTTQVQETTDIHEYEVVGLMYKGISWVAHGPKVADKGPTLETGTFKNDSEAEPEAKFGPDWIEDEAEAKATEILEKIKEEIKARLKAEAQKKLDEQKK